MKRKIILSIFLFLASPAVSFAWVPSSLKTYTVWNQFDPTVSAFQALGLLMSDSRYQDLFFGIIVIGILIGGISATLGAFTGRNPFGSFIRWFGLVVIGVMIYMTFVQPTTDMIIFDEATNQQTQVGGIPEGIVFLAGLTNVIEAGFVDMIATAGDPMSYRNDAGGLTFTIFDRLFDGGVNMSGDTTNTQSNLYRSLQKYFSDCVFFEMGLPDARITPNDFNNTTDFTTLLEKAKNPAIFTVYWNAANPGGTTLSCTDAWTAIKNDFTAINDLSLPVSLFWTNRCASAGLGTSVTATSETNICINKAQGAMNNIFGSSFSASQIFKQFFVTRMMWDLFNSYSSSNAVQALSSRTAGNSMVGMGIMANQWIPVMRGVVFSIFVGLLPFLCLFIPTPLFPKIMSFIFGIFIFFASWTICDALVNGFAVKCAMDIFREIQTGQLGYTSMLMFSSAAQKSLAMYGAARWMAVMLAGLMSGMLTKFGGIALVHFTQGLASARQHGSEAAGTMSDPSKWAQQVRATSDVYPTMAMANSRLNDVAGMGNFEFHRRIGEANTASGYFGGSSSLGGKAVGNAAGMTDFDAVARSNEIKSYAALHQMTPAAVQQAVQNFEVDSKAGSAMALKNLSKSLNATPQEAMDFMKAIGMNQEYGQISGLETAYTNARTRNGYSGSMSDYVAMQAGIEKMKGFADASAIANFSRNYSGGEAGFLKDQAEFRTSQIASQLSSISEHGATPAGVGQVLGDLEGVRNLVDSNVFQNVGDRGIWLTRAGEQYSQLSQFVMRKAGNDIMTTGQISGETESMLGMLRNNPIAAAQLKAQQGSGLTVAVSPENAGNLAQWMNTHGSNVNASDLTGGVVSLSMADNKGNLAPAMVVSSKGQKIGNFDLHTQDEGYRGTFGDESKSYGGGQGENFGGIKMAHVNEATVHGNVALVDGIGKDGHQYQMVMNTNGYGREDSDKWTAVQKKVSRGFDFGNNLTISDALGKQLPSDVFENRAASVAYATKMARDLSPFISKIVSNGKSTEFANQLRMEGGVAWNSESNAVGKLVGLASGLSAHGRVTDAGQRTASSISGTRTETDAVAGALQNILTDPVLSSGQKTEAIHTFVKAATNNYNTPMKINSPDIDTIVRQNAIAGKPENRVDFPQPEKPSGRSGASGSW